MRAEKAQRVQAAIAAIQSARQQALHHEAEQVRNQILVGVGLNKLVREGRRAASAEARRLGLTRAEVRRHRNLGAGLGACEDGVGVADLLPRLPADLRKLEQVARLSRDGRLTLLGRIDPKTAGLKQLRDGVEALLGLTRKPRSKPSGLARARKVPGVLLGILGDLTSEPDEGGRLSPLRAALADAAERVRAELARAEEQATAGSVPAA
jgi:hypothetical protein